MGKKDTIRKLQKEIVIPDIVQMKADLAFEQIKRESTEKKYAERKHTEEKQTEKKHTEKNEGRKEYQKEMKRSGKKRKKKVTIWTILAAALLILGTMTACAAAYVHWSRGMEEGLNATPEKKMILEEENMVVDISEDSVTEAGVTIKPILSVTDNYFSRMSFQISGYDLPEGVEPGFESISLTLDGTDGISWGGSFYNGIHINDEGVWKYDDGTDARENENGGWIERYVAEDGTMEYDLYLLTGTYDINLIGRTMHLVFENLGRAEKAGVTPEIMGTWAFDIELKGSDKARSIALDALLGDSGAVVTSVDISPVSIHVTYDFGAQAVEVEASNETTGEKVMTTLYEEPPAISGVRLKDGTLLWGIMGAGWMGWNEGKDIYQSCQMTADILDLDQVDALLFLKTQLEGEGEPTEEDFYIVPIGEE